MQPSQNPIRNDLRISALALEDRPREKLIHKGISSLSEAELIGILIGSGTREMNAVELARKILCNSNNNLNELAKLNISDLQKFKGIGEAKAINIISALELGRRRKDKAPEKRAKIKSSQNVYDIMRPYFLDAKKEQFWVILMNKANGIIKKSKISDGGISGTVVDPKIVFKEALDNLASNIILIHNHPSGNLKPSAADVTITNKIKEAGNLLDIPVLDHIIFTDNGYFSFVDEGIL